MIGPKLNKNKNVNKKDYFSRRQIYRPIHGPSRPASSLTVAVCLVMVLRTTAPLSLSAAAFTICALVAILFFQRSCKWVELDPGARRERLGRSKRAPTHSLSLFHYNVCVWMGSGCKSKASRPIRGKLVHDKKQSDRYQSNSPANTRLLNVLTQSIHINCKQSTLSQQQQQTKNIQEQ